MEVFLAHHLAVFILASVHALGVALSVLLSIFLRELVAHADLSSPALLRRTDAVVSLGVLANFALHVPVPLVDLALLETEAVLELDDLGLQPDGVLLELTHENLVLLAVLSEALLSLLSTLDPVADNDTGDDILACGRILIGACANCLMQDITILFHSLFRHFNGSCVLVEGSLRFLLEKRIDALVQVFACHVVINYAETREVYGLAIPFHNIVSGLREFRFLLDNLNWFAAWATFRCTNQSGLGISFSCDYHV